MFTNDTDYSCHLKAIELVYLIIWGPYHIILVISTFGADTYTHPVGALGNQIIVAKFYLTRFLFMKHCYWRYVCVTASCMTVTTQGS